MAEEFTAFAALERAGWADEDVARGYCDSFTAIADQAIGALVAAAGPVRGQPALDLCCGPGKVAAALLAAGADVTGVDFSPAMVAHARAAVPGARIVHGDAQALDLPDAAFDAVLSNLGICHVPDQPAALAECGRVLRPGGRLAFTVWVGPPDSAAFALMSDAIAAHGSAAVQAAPEPGFHRFADPATAGSVVGAAGFTDIEVSQIDCVWTLSSPDRLIAIFEGGTVRVRDLLLRQPEAARAAVRQAAADLVRARWDAGDGTWRVPMPAALITARAA
ncbi:class I SAM-dependent methyltransferase [Rhodobacteraceae bacterium CCMM004]|nr:class I SAM-dependent methyltransferase [Rhodobacteraceae bacterium CCMM004]